jgi:hypothetical protein
MAEFSIERAVWTALQPQRPMTLDELQMLTGADAGDIVGYLNILIRNRYAEVLGIKQATSGEAIALFRLTNATGPQAPYGDNILFVDPNFLNRPRPKREPAPLPTMQGRIRLAAERLGRPFKRHEMIDAVNRAGRDYRTGWDRLVWAGELVQTGESDENGIAFFDVRPKSDLGPVREWFRSHLGHAVDVYTLKAAGLQIGNGPQIRKALDMLAAEGFSVSIKRRDNGKRTVYRVDAPKEHTA